MTKWRRKSDGLECDVFGAAFRHQSGGGGSTSRMLSSILPHLPMAAQQAALGDGWEPCGETLGEKLGRLDPITKGMIDWDEVRRVQQRLDAPQTAPVAQEAPMKPLGGWQPIETAPKDGTRVLAWGPSIGGRPYITTGAGARLSAIHWQPLPEPPAD
jgi:hypothetical protein